MMRLLQSRWKKSRGRPITIYALIILLLNLPLLADAKEPVQDLEQNISRAIRILNESRHSEDGSQTAQLQELWELLVKSFDFHEFSRRVLASHWKRFSAREQEVFIDVFSRFIGDFYLRKVLDLYSGEKVIFIEQAKVTDSKAVVSLQVQRRGLKIPVKVKMLKRDGSWKVYDLVFLGISGVSNYRAQFRVLLKKQSPAQVIASIREKMERQRVKQGNE